MKRVSKLLFVLLIGVCSFIGISNVDAKNDVTLNFKGGIIHDGYVEYSKVAKVQLFKGDDLVVGITNNMIVDLDEAEYKFVIEEIEDNSVSGVNTSVKLNINNWYYPMTTIVGESKSAFKLETSKFNGKLDVKFERRITAINTKVENVYNGILSNGVIDLTGGKEYVIDFSKTDELTEGLKSFADLDKTLYYKRDNKGLSVTDNESEAVIKIVGNRSENKAILTEVNVGTKKSDIFKGFHTQYTGSKLTFTGSDGGVIYETRTDYYTRCTYDFTFKYREDVKEYKVVDGANQKYLINKNKTASFKIDASYDLFKSGGRVYVDGKLVDEKNYVSKEGSTIITFNDSYLSGLSIGTHSLKVVFSDGGVASTKFVISRYVENPETSDNALISFATLFISVVGMSSCFVLKRRFN